MIKLQMESQLRVRDKEPMETYVASCDSMLAISTSFL